MENKKYIIAVVVVALLWGAYMGYRQMTKKSTNETHNEDTYKRMVEMAKKSPRAGLAQMARALNRFYEDNKKYPGSLDELYPKYVASRAFLGEIDWGYEAGVGDFYLTKTGTFNNREMVASIDSSLKVELDTGEAVAVARRRAPPPQRVVREVAEEAPVEEVVEFAELKIVDDYKMTGNEASVVIAAAGTDGAVTENRPTTDIDLQREMSRAIVQAGPEIVAEEKEAEFVTNLEHYLVWKDAEGFIGISNTQLPDLDKMYVAISDRWYKVRRVKPAREITAVKDNTSRAKEIKDVAQLAQDLSGEYLVWKDENGVMGVGNVQYPEKEQLTIAQADEWNTLKSKPLRQDRKTVETEKAETKPDSEKLAASLSREYLVWKDEKGVMGISNVQYPDQDRLSIAAAGQWNTLKSEPLALRRESASPVRTEPPKDQDMIAASAGGQYLVWKDKNGVIGFGNVQYPEMQNVSYVHSDRSWEKVVN